MIKPPSTRSEGVLPKKPRKPKMALRIGNIIIKIDISFATVS